MGGTLLEIIFELLVLLGILGIISNNKENPFFTVKEGKSLNSGIYIKSVFNVVPDEELSNFVRDYDNNKERLKDIFSVMPQRATEFSAGYDLAVVNDEVIHAHESKLISFGNSVFIENPTVTGVVVPRSSLARKRGLIIAGGAHYIYCGEGHSCLTLKFINYSDTDVELKVGDKIAQVVFIKYPSWIIGDFKDMCELETNKSSIFPDPLDETFMSPLLDKNIEVVFTMQGYDKVDQTDRLCYYFQSLKDVELEPGKVTCIMTGLRCKIDGNQVFLLKNAFNNPCVELANTIGVIDSDYYDNPDNAGEMGVLLLNRGNVPVKVNKGDVIASGAVYYYEKADGDVYGGKRVGGFGSTDTK